MIIGKYQDMDCYLFCEKQNILILKTGSLSYQYGKVSESNGFMLTEFIGAWVVAELPRKFWVLSLEYKLEMNVH